MDKIIYTTRVFVALAVTVILWTGCTPSTKATAETYRDSTQLRVGALPTSECLSLFYADRIGLTDSMNVSIQLFRSVNDAYQALCLDQIDVALIDTLMLARHNQLLDRYFNFEPVIVTDSLYCDSLLEALPDTSEIKRDSVLVNGMPPIELVAICHATDKLWLVANDSCQVRGTGGLTGKLVGYWRYSASEEAVRRLNLFAKYEEGDVFYIQVGDITLRYRMLMQHLIDAAFLPQPYATAAIRLGHNRLQCAATDTLRQSVWAVRTNYTQSTEARKCLQQLLATETENADTLRRVMQDIYLLPDTLILEQ